MATSRTPRASAPADPAPDAYLDPYLEWARATGYRYIRGTPSPVPTRIPLLVELSPTSTYEDFVQWINGSQVRQAIEFVFDKPPSGCEKTRFLAVTIKPDAVDSLDAVFNQPGWKQRVARFGLGFPPTERRVIVPSKVPTGRRGAIRTSPVVVIGVIDDSIAFAHARFRNRDGSRVGSVWNQDTVLFSRNGTAQPGPGLEGGQLTKVQIDEWLAECTHAGQVDEDELYRRCAHETYDNTRHKSIGRRLGHGTHVLDLAAGAEPKDNCTDRPIVAVELPAEVTGDTSGALLIPQVLLGIWFVLMQADTRPVVINLSYGFAAGPHDGTSVLEAAIDELVEMREAVGLPLCVVLPSGNSRLARGHGELTLEAGAKADLAWRALPDDRTPSSMEIWLPKVASGITVQVTPPVGPPTPLLR